MCLLQGSRALYGLAVWLVLLFMLPEASPCRAGEVDAKKPPGPTFEADVLPILTARCVMCHGGESPERRLDLGSRGGILRGGRSGAAIRLGAAETSLLWEKIAANEMPAKGPPLTAAQKGIIRTWINDGAPGATGGEAAAVALKSDVTASDREFWSFRPPGRPELPAVRNAGRVRTPVDAFVLARLEKQELTLSPEADRATLLRRTFYDLIGLPPSPGEIETFLGDTRDDAYERLVERLLSSPHHGERWGRHWLDAAGYADSAGVLSEDRPLQFAWRYRNYVVRAWNDDRPYDRFLQEQIAGDELVDYWTAFETLDRLPEHVIEGVIATGYLRCAPDSSRPDFSTIKNAAALYYYPTLDSTVRIVASSTMGLSVQCARCHGHKFDPIPQVEYYRMQAIFMSGYRPTQWIPQMKRRIVQATASQRRAAEEHNGKIDARVKALEKELKALWEDHRKRLIETRLATLPEAIRPDVQKALASDAAKRSEVEKYLAAKFQPLLQPDDKTLDRVLPKTYPDYGKRAAVLQAEVAAQQRRRRHFDEIRALYDLPGEVSTPYLRRGDPLTPGSNVEPGVLTALTTDEPFRWKRPPEGARTSGRRLAFARWLTQPGHPLTARVMVNRIWLHHLGEGIVATADDFGRAGSAPSHPGLLDWLATEFVQSGWSIKHMHRVIMLSSTYRQVSRRQRGDADGDLARAHRAAARVDPDNRLLWRQRLRRLEAEPLRDAMFDVSGTLDTVMFSRPVRMARQGDGEVTTVGRGNCRSIYLQVMRSHPLTLLELFDQPVMETNCLRRSQSTVSTQALTLLNSESMVATAAAFAGRVLRERPDDPAGHAFLLAFSRPPTGREHGELTAFVDSQARAHVASLVSAPAAVDNEILAKARRQAIADLCHMVLSANEFLYID